MFVHVRSGGVIHVVCMLRLHVVTMVRSVLMFAFYGLAGRRVTISQPQRMDAWGGDVKYRRENEKDQQKRFHEAEYNADG